jgi:hypothetical protein
VRPKSGQASWETRPARSPIVGDQAEFQAQRTQLHRLCAGAGRDDLDVTAFLFELDEQLLACCAELGVTRCAVVAPTRDLTAFQSFLDRYLAVAERVCR